MSEGAAAAVPQKTGTVVEGLTLSVVSHGHDDCLHTLLAQLAQQHAGVLKHLIVTHNLPEQCSPLPTPPGGWPFELTELHNRSPQGFGHNHNQAFQHCRSRHFGVINPDLEDLPADLWPRLVALADQPGVGCAYPRLLNLDGTVQDSEREIPTPWALLKRYTHRPPVPRRDWVNAACWVLQSDIWRQMGGFDEGYFLYCEDVDFCLRLQTAGWQLARADTHMTHHAQRTSHRQWRYVSLHLRSLLRLWTTPAMYRYQRHLRQQARR